ncbi:MAG TPA: DegQ family serine endoprotease [Pyrinomonadaceae bacterium]|jgi:Do/DeqQ family serine protease|nr:DegQ family serine endoprotease [Pyrinomonadaceae bacterium]
MLSNKFFVIILLAAVLFIGGCKTGLLGGGETPTVPQPQAPAPVSVDGVRTSYADVVEKTSPAVVRIDAEHKTNAQSPQFPLGNDDMFKQFQMPQRPQIERGVGSGVIVSADGTILTNYHVIDGAEKITVSTNDNKSFEAKVVGSDQPSDLAVVKIEAENLPYLTLGNSDNVRVGDMVLAIGNPLGIGQTVTAGIISAKGRRTGLSDGGIDSYQDFLQTDAPINRGNSGGALVNLNGELIGINSQILSSPGSAGGNIGIGFAIPSNMAKSVMEQLLKDGKVHRGMLGINIQNITEDAAKALELKDTEGVLVSNVRPGSAAEKAGLKRGDVIVAVNGEKIEDSNVLRNKVAGTQPGAEMKLTVLRDGSTEELTAKLDEFDSNQARNNGSDTGDNENNSGKGSQNGKLGVTLQPLTPQMAKQLNVPEGIDGLVVTDVDPTGTAADSGVSRGDVISEINRQPVKTLQDVQAAIAKSGNGPVLLLVTRQGQTVFLTVRPE